MGMSSPLSPWHVRRYGVDRYLRAAPRVADCRSHVQWPPRLQVQAQTLPGRQIFVIRRAMGSVVNVATVESFLIAAGAFPQSSSV